jgi:hypothetical protein
MVSEPHARGERFAVGQRPDSDALQRDLDFGVELRAGQTIEAAVLDAHPALDVAGIGGTDATGAGHRLPDHLLVHALLCHSGFLSVSSGFFVVLLVAPLLWRAINIGYYTLNVNELFRQR